ncbi:hypothetical protein [Candidatus Ichthyocystis sparus]|nr:hypothetical protein [Candidatus Ichthyocystis sparus]
MKRKLSGSEASSTGSNDGQGGADWQVQSSSELGLEQGAVSDDTSGVVLPPRLAQSLGMSPGDRIFRSMFYGTPQASFISSLAAQLLDEHEALISRASGEGTSSASQSGGGDCDSALMASNEMSIRALLDSIEAPRPYGTEVPQLQVVPAVAVEGVDTTHSQAPGPSALGADQVADTMYWQAPGPSAPEQSTVGFGGGFVLAPDLALELGMYPDQLLRRSMFYGTSNFDVILNMVSQLSAVQEGLLASQELERSVVAQDGVITDTDFQGTASLIAANDELIRALMGSIEVPAVGRTTAIEGFAAELGEKLLSKLEEEKNKEIAQSKAELYMKEQEEVERKKEEEKKVKKRKREEKEVKKKENVSAKIRKEAAKRRLLELRASLGLSLCRETELKIAKIKVKEIAKRIVENMEMTSLLELRKKGMGGVEDVHMIEVYGELRRLVVEPIPEDLREMEKELEKARERCRELNQAGEGEAQGGGAASEMMDELVTREASLRMYIKRAILREERMGHLEKELEMLMAKELDLEERSTNDEYLLGRVRTRKNKVRADIEKIKGTTMKRGGSLDLGIKLDRLMVKKAGIEAGIDVGIREIELDRLRKKAKDELGDSELGEKELNLMLRLEGTKARVRELEVELGLWLGKMEAKKKEAMDRVTSLSLGGRWEAVMRAKEEEVEVLRTIVLGGSEVAEAWGGAGNISTSELVPSVIVVQELGEERAMAMRIRELELELETSIVLERSGAMEERSETETMEELELELGRVRVQEQKLGPELDRMVTYVMNIDKLIWEGRVTSGADSTEMEAKKSRLIELNRSRAIARLRELGLRIGLSKARLKARGLVLALEKLRRVVE